MAPEELRIRPAGKLPEVIDQVYGGTPPVAASEAIKGTPIDPALSEEVVIDRGGLTVTASEAMSTAAVGVWESVTDTLKVVEAVSARGSANHAAGADDEPGRQRARCKRRGEGPLTPSRGQRGGIRNDYGDRKCG